MTPDPRWLEILKASGWQTTAITLACGVFLLGVHLGWLPSLPSSITLLLAFATLLCGFLAAASLASAALKFFPVQTWILYYVNRYRQKREVEKYIPFMTDQERNIIAYLLHHKQKTFTTTIDGGHAVTLISRRIVQSMVRGNQTILSDDMPVMIPDHLWELFCKHHDEFVYSDDGSDAHPWRVHWMLR